MPTTEYDALLDLIAAHPGADRDEIHDPRATPIAPMLTLSTTASMTRSPARTHSKRTSTTGSCGRAVRPVRVRSSADGRVARRQSVED